MPKPEHALLVAALLLIEISVIAQDDTLPEWNRPELENRCNDRFDKENSGEYFSIGNPEWQAGSIKLPKGASIGRLTPLGGSEVLVQVECEFDEIQAEGNRTTTRVTIMRYGNQHIAIDLTRVVVDGKFSGLLDVQILEEGKEDLKDVRLVDVDPEKMNGVWKFDVNYGLLRITGPGGFAATAFVPGNSLMANGVGITQVQGTSLLKSLQISMSRFQPPKNQEEALDGARISDRARQRHSNRDYRGAAADLKVALPAIAEGWGSDTLPYSESLALLAQVQAELGDREGESETVTRLLGIWSRLLHPDHPSISNVMLRLAEVSYHGGRYQAAEKFISRCLKSRRLVYGDYARETAAGLNVLGNTQTARSEYEKAHVSLTNSLAIYTVVDGEEAASTAMVMNNLGILYRKIGMYEEAKKELSRCLEIRLKLLPEDSTQVITTRDNLANVLSSRGDYESALTLYNRNLDLLVDENGNRVANSQVIHTLTNRGNLLSGTGRLEAGEADYRAAYELVKGLSGEDHPLALNALDGIAACRIARFDFVAAEPLVMRCVAIAETIHGRNHTATAAAYDRLGHFYSNQFRFAEAEQALRESLAILEQVPPGFHPQMANVYGALGGVAIMSGKPEEAERDYRRDLELTKEFLSSEHPRVGVCLANLADALSHQGRDEEALIMLDQAVAHLRKTFPEDSRPVQTYSRSKAAILMSMERYDEAAEILGSLDGEDAIASNAKLLQAKIAAEKGNLQEAERLLREMTRDAENVLELAAYSGFGQAARRSTLSPRPFLVSILVQQGNSDEAWKEWEAGLAFGLGYDLNAEQLPYSDAERQHLEELARQVAQARSVLSFAERQPGEFEIPNSPRVLNLRQHLNQLQAEFSSVQSDLRAKYGTPEKATITLPSLQAELPGDTAIVGWVAGRPNHAVLVRKRGAPVWVPLPDAVEAATITRIASALSRGAEPVPEDGGRSTQSVHQSIAQLRASLWEPLEQALRETTDSETIRHLIVLPSPLLQQIPVEVFAQDQYVVSYCPSASIYVALSTRAQGRASGLLAVGDPRFSPVDDSAADFEFEYGVLVNRVVPGSAAATSGIHPGDVLMEIGDQRLKSPADLLSVVAALRGKGQGSTARVWNAGQIRQVELPAIEEGQPLGVGFHQTPARTVLNRRIQIERRTSELQQRIGWKPLPGTRAEVEAIGEVFQAAGQKQELLLGSQATLDGIMRLAESGELADFRYIHLATHGIADATRPLQSRIILSQVESQETTGGDALAASDLSYELTAESVMHAWKLKADLVVLSACQSGLGRLVEGEGYLGFTQALLVAGGRNLVLSLWNVDDTATALLMARLYENLLGQRNGLTSPLTAADALHEAKDWLRHLKRDELPSVLSRYDLSGRHVPSGDRPFADPEFWAAFILVGAAD